MPTHDDDAARPESGDDRKGAPFPAPGLFRSVAEVACYLNVGAKTVRRMIQDGQLVAHKVRGQLRIHDANLKGYLDGVRR